LKKGSEEDVWRIRAEIMKMTCSNPQQSHSARTMHNFERWNIEHIYSPTTW